MPLFEKLFLELPLWKFHITPGYRHQVIDTLLTSLHAKQIIAVEYVLPQVESGHVTAFMSMNDVQA